MAGEFELSYSDRGFPRLELADFYGKPIKIILSSLADDECVWLGDNHLTREMAAATAARLQAFADEGVAYFHRIAPPPRRATEAR